jgi:hypothetical protein
VADQSDSIRTAGRFEILRQVGHGGMAVVYLARQRDLDRFVALKELRLMTAPDPTLAQRFLREAQMAGSLSHPNIVTVHEHFEHDGTPYIAMEYLERGSLRPYIGRMTMAQIAGVLEGVLAGLDHASHHEIIHRDLKPENLMVTREGRIKIADFGIARARNRLQTGAFMTATGTTVGTPTYMAPEQAMAKNIGPYTDLYSVGVMAYEMVSGQVPFHDTETPVAILLRHINDVIPPAMSVNPDVNPELSAWIERLLVKEYADRTQTASQAWDELEDIVIGMLGSRWRRDARLPEMMPQGGMDRPLTPASFTATSGEALSTGFQSFGWGDAPAAPPADAAPAEPVARSAPAPAAAPSPPAGTPPVAPGAGAVTPPPAAGEPPPATAPAEPSGFQTAFGSAPAAPEAAPSEPAETPLEAADAVAEAPVPETADEPAPPPVDAAPASTASAPASPPAPASASAPASPPAPASAPAEPSGFQTAFGSVPAPAEAPPPEPPETPLEAADAAVAEAATPAPEEEPAPAPGTDAFRTFGRATRSPAATPVPEPQPVAEQAPEVAPEPEAAPEPEPEPAPEAHPEPAVAAAAPLTAPGLETVMPDAVPEPVAASTLSPPTRDGRGAGAEPGTGARGRWAVLGVAGVAALAIGFLVGHSGGGSDKKASTTASATPVAQLDSDAIALRVPAGWASADGASLDGLTLGDPVAAAPAAGGGQGVVAGTLAAGDLGPRLLPTSLASGAPQPSAVRLAGGLEAYKYSGLRVGGQSVILFAIPTADGAVALACHGKAAGDEALGAACGAIAGTLKLKSGQAGKLAPDSAVGQDLGAALTRLQRTSAAALRTLGEAKTPTGQASAARSAGQAYAAAARTVQGLAPGAGAAKAFADLADALSGVGKAYTQLGAAARAHDSAAYTRATRTIGTAQQDLQKARAALEPAGYSVKGS